MLKRAKVFLKLDEEYWRKVKLGENTKNIVKAKNELRDAPHLMERATSNQGLENLWPETCSDKRSFD